MIIISTHAPFSLDGDPIANTGYSIPMVLEDRGIDFCIIYHSLHGGHNSCITEYIGGKRLKYVSKYSTSKNLFFKSIHELFITVKIVMKFNKDVIKIDRFIGIDPLNAIFGIIVRKFLGINISNIIFYTADYADQRFKNKMLNSIYHKIDIYSAKESDEVWSVSNKINNLRIHQGIMKEKCKTVINSMYMPRRGRVNLKSKQMNKLILVSTIVGAMELISLMRAIKLLKEKKKNFVLTIVGVEKLDNKIQKYISKHKLDSNVRLIKYLDHDNLVKYLDASSIGIAIYKRTESNPWIDYCDSMKMRDYMASGNPVIMSDFLENASELENFALGKAVSFDDYKSIASAIEMITSSRRAYMQYATRALKYSETTSFEKSIKHILN